MKAAVLVFPGSNREVDVAQAIELVTGRKPHMIWHGDGDFEKTDLIVVPGGFSYGDYLRCGAMAAHSPIMRDVIDRAKKGTPILGICNGFQILCETQLLPGVLMRNASLKFASRSVTMTVEGANTMFTAMVERRREIGLWRVVGATRRQLVGRLVLEAALLGLCGSVLGLVAGLLATDGLTAFPERLLTGERPEPTFLVTKPFSPDMVKALISQALFFEEGSRAAA